jgi:hypothetical protein
MSTQASVHSIEALKDLRASYALFAEDAAAALGAVDMEIRRTILWLQHDRRMFWQEQIKRRREQVALARAEVFRRQLAQKPDYSPPMTEQKELLRRAEASLQDAEKRAALVKKWEPALQQAVLEYRGSTRRISSIATGDVPRALVLLEKMIEALEAYLRVAPPAGARPVSPLERVAESFLKTEPAGSEETNGALSAAEQPANPEDVTENRETPRSLGESEPHA